MTHKGPVLPFLVCEEDNGNTIQKMQTSTLEPEVILAHLDKSHITVHTYPEYHPHDGVCTFRADIDVSTCGQISRSKPSIT